MNFDFTKKQLAIKKMIKDFADKEVKPYAADADQKEIFPEEQIMELIPMKEMGLPKDVADLAVFLVSEQSRYITGQVIRIDGGLGI